ncbi:MAG: hypothetical protein CBD77_03775 [bacterium TMED217]|nr:MAG: hypothetical protein CBD77_03775 [bacterium TMED217]
MKLYNKKSKQELIKNLNSEQFKRITCSFYNYIPIKSPQVLRDIIYSTFESLKIFGRIYIASEGINAQISVPDYFWDEFIEKLKKINDIGDIPIKKAVNEGASFYKLVVKVKKEIVAYGLSKELYDMNKVGKHLKPQEFNKAIDEKNTIVIDMRNFYESEVGRFKDAEIPLVEKSKELLPEVRKMLNGRENKQVLLYCTGGIRCEKASSYLIKSGISNVKQLEGGIIQYAHDIKKKGIKSKFVGKNFVFDARLGERITDDVIAKCHLCGEPTDNHHDCNYDACHILFIQCADCSIKLHGCCSEECKENSLKTIEEQKIMRKNPKNIIKKRYFRSPKN